MKPRSFIARASAKTLAKNGGKMFSTVKRSTKPIPQMNVEATKKRRERNAKRMRGAEYKAARAGAMERSGGRCEYTTSPSFPVRRRCEETTRLQFHELRYPKSRPLTANDGLIYCYAHHMLAEKQKPNKWHKGAF